MGNALNNMLSGSAGNGSLIGRFGNDSIMGGGNDQFILNGPGEDIDTIRDFNSAEDIIVISAAAFGGGLLAGAPMNDDLLRVGLGISDAATASQRFIYNQSNGKLLFDADGSETAFGATHIATIINRSLLVTRIDDFSTM